MKNVFGGDWVEYLPGETELQDHLKVGRNTLRSALDVLRREGTAVSP